MDRRGMGMRMDDDCCFGVWSWQAKQARLQSTVRAWGSVTFKSGRGGMAAWGDAWLHGSLLFRARQERNAAVARQAARPPQAQAVEVRRRSGANQLLEARETRAQGPWKPPSRRALLPTKCLGTLPIGYT
jgi:hypothetical protein